MNTTRPEISVAKREGILNLISDFCKDFTGSRPGNDLTDDELVDLWFKLWEQFHEKEHTQAGRKELRAMGWLIEEPDQEWLVEIKELGGWSDAEWTEEWNNETIPLRFNSAEAAQKHIDAMICEQHDAVQAGHMTSKYDRADYRVVPAPKQP